MSVDVETPGTADSGSQSQTQNVLDSVDGEIHFFKSLMRARPIGVHRHFHIITMQAAIEKALKQSVPIEDIWAKLESCYNLDALEVLEAEYEASGNLSNSLTPPASNSLRIGQYPFPPTEYTLPADSYIENLIAERRVRSTPSPDSSPERSQEESRPSASTRRGRKRKQSKVDLAGLVSGDSDSSDLTQQSNDDGEEAETPSARAASVLTGTDGGTEILDDEDEEKGEAKPKRGRKPGRARGNRGRRRKR